MSLKQALNILILIFSLAILTSMLLEKLYHMTPCVLCNLQRFITLVMLVVALIQRLLLPRWSVLLYWLLVLFNILGLALSARHVWLQSQPVSEVQIQCLPSFSVLWSWLPWHEVLSTILKGDALCQTVAWSFLGLSLAMWLGLLYAFILLFTIAYVKKLSN